MANFDRTWNGRIADAHFGWANSPEVNSCGTGRRSVVFKYQNGPDRGLFRVAAGAANPVGVSLAVRGTCDAQESELACLPADTNWVEVRELAPNEEVFLILDGTDAQFSGKMPFQVGTFFEAYLAEGDSCELEPKAGDKPCADGLACGENDDDEHVCMKDEAPELDRVRVYRDGARIAVLADGYDEPGNVEFLEVLFNDAAGNPLGFDGYAVEGTALLRPADRIIGKRDFRADWVHSRFFTNPTVAQAVSVTMRLVDNKQNVSKIVDAPIAPMPLVGPGDPCDRLVRENVCAEAHECGPNGVCRPAP
jgi:hypothetical protein